MLLMHANHREDIKEAYAGDIIALAGLKEARTGDTLCDPQKPVILEKMEFPDPVIEIAVEPKTKADQEKLGVALSRLAAEDPSFRVSTDQESGQTILKGMGELHLDIKVDILQAHLQGRRQCRRAAGGLSRDDHARRSRTHYTHKKQTGGSGQFAAVELEVEPSGVGDGYQLRVEDRRRRGAEGIHPGRREGRRVGADLGAADRLPGGRRQGGAGRRQVPRRRLVGARLRDRVARRPSRGAEAAGPVLLEPIMKVEVVTPEEYLGSVIGDLNSRRGQIAGTDTRGNAQVVNAMVPLANMFGYVNTLRSMSQGRANYTMQFDHYEQVPQRRGAGSPGEVRLICRHETRLKRKTESPDGQRKIRADEAALQHRHDRPCRPWQDVADGGDHQGAGRDGQGDVQGV